MKQGVQQPAKRPSPEMECARMLLSHLGMICHDAAWQEGDHNRAHLERVALTYRIRTAPHVLREGALDYLRRNMMSYDYNSAPQYRDDLRLLLSACSDSVQ